MRRISRPLLLVFCALFLAANKPPAPPSTRTDNVKETIHGVEVVDPYRWLEDQNSPETRAWIDAQNAYSDAFYASLPGQEPIKTRLGELMRVDNVTTPQQRDGRYFFFRRSANQDLPVLYLRQGAAGKDEVLIDPHPMSADHRTSVNLFAVSQDGTLLAYGVRKGGEDETTIHLFDVDARRDRTDVLPRARYGGVSLTPDNKSLYYSRLTREGTRVFLHQAGSDSAADAEVFGKGYTPDKIVSANVSPNGHSLLITVSHGAAGDRTELYFQDLRKPDAPITTIVNDLPARFFGSFADDQLFLETNWNAPNSRIMAVSLGEPARDKWREVIPENKAVIQGFSLAGGKLFVLYAENALTRVAAFEPGGKHLHDISFPTLGHISGVGGRWNSNEAFFTFTSFHVPPTIYRYDVARATRAVWYETKVPVDSTKFEVKQVWYASKDGTRVPMFLLHRKGIALDGSHPALLTGYGGFNSSQTPAFAPRAILWAEHGGVYAVANLRGGNEFGEKWHRAGMLENKQNVFDDFIAAGEWLVANKYTRPSRLAITGTSNGGLLVGAALTQRPDLFAAVICGYPLLDMLRYQKFLVARFWVPEYGSSEDADQFKYIYAYSPYQHVKPGTKYPAVLLVSGDSDTRVAPLHARKMTALLQASTGSDKPVLLHYDTKAGHSGGRPLSLVIDDLTHELAFLLHELDVN